MTKESLMAFIIILFTVVSAVGGHFSIITTNIGNPTTSTNFLTFITDTWSFFIGMFVFSVSGVPIIFNLLWYIMTALLIWIILLMIRGD